MEKTSAHAPSESLSREYANQASSNTPVNSAPLLEEVVATLPTTLEERICQIEEDQDQAFTMLRDLWASRAPCPASVLSGQLLLPSDHARLERIARTKGSTKDESPNTAKVDVRIAYEEPCRLKRKHEQRLPLAPKRCGKHRIDARQPGGHRRHQNFTPLNVAREEVLRAIRDHPALRRPRPLAPNRGDQSKFCNYHQGYGHDTENCTRLKEEIERFVHLGFIGKFLQTQTRGQQPPNMHAWRKEGEEGARNATNEPGHFETHAPRPGDASRNVINESDSSKKCNPHLGPSNISAAIGEPPTKINQILVDDDVTVNVLFMSTLLQLRLASGNIKLEAASARVPGSPPIPVLGTVILPITLGEPPIQVTYHVQFIVIQADSDYTAILQRSLLDAFLASARCYHSLQEQL